MLLQVLEQGNVIGKQSERCRDLEASVRQLQKRCSELKEASGERTGEGAAACACAEDLGGSACGGRAACGCQSLLRHTLPCAGILEEVGTEVLRHLSKPSDVVNAATACKALRASFLRPRCWQPLTVELPFPGEAR